MAMSWHSASVLTDYAMRSIRRLGRQEDLERDLPLVPGSLMIQSQYLGVWQWLAFRYLSPVRVLPILLGLAWVAVIAVHLWT
jgi:hypothetical protein